MLNLELLATKEIGVNGMAVCLKPKIPVVITPGLVNEIRHLQNSLAEKYLSGTLIEEFYVVWFLENRKGLSYRGLDFTFLRHCIKNNKNNELEHYIDGVFDLIFLNYIGLGFPIINCSIVSRTLSGLSKEFFFLNKICFIHNTESSGITKFSLCKDFTPLLLEKEIYDKNHYFYYDSLRLDKMRDVIECTPYEVPLIEEINSIKEKFESLKNETLVKIYDIASKNIKILDRLAKANQKLCS